MAPTKRASTRRKSTRRPRTKRTSTSRSRTRKTTTRRKTPKGLRLTRKTQKQILIAVAVVVGVLIFLALMQKTTYVQKKFYQGEVARNAVYGKVTGVAIGVAGRGTISVRSYNTGKTYTFYTGVRTRYNIKRYPRAGDRAKVYYVYDRGYRKATYVRLR
jgi:hypothetical protein